MDGGGISLIIMYGNQSSSTNIDYIYTGAGYYIIPRERDCVNIILQDDASCFH